MRCIVEHLYIELIRFESQNRDASVREIVVARPLRVPGAKHFGQQ